MRRLTAVPLACLLPLAGCGQPAATSNVAAVVENGAAAVPVPAPMPGGERLILQASDGKDVHGVWYEAEHPRAVILLFHQARGSKGEYAAIAPRLKEMRFDALAIDQRSGGDLFGHNENSTYPVGDKGYLASKADLEGALAWARSKAKGVPVILWGSSYSAALSFVVAAEHPGEVAAVVAFSPAEYLDSARRVRTAAGKLRIPAFMAASRSYYEKTEADALAYMMRKLPDVVRFDDTQLVHGSSMAVPERNPQGAVAVWKSLTDFLDKVARK